MGNTSGSDREMQLFSYRRTKSLFTLWCILASIAVPLLIGEQYRRASLEGVYLDSKYRSMCGNRCGRGGRILSDNTRQQVIDTARLQPGRSCGATSCYLYQKRGLQNEQGFTRKQGINIPFSRRFIRRRDLPNKHNWVPYNCMCRGHRSRIRIIGAGSFLPHATLPATDKEGFLFGIPPGARSIRCKGPEGNSQNKFLHCCEIRVGIRLWLEGNSRVRSS